MYNSLIETSFSEESPGNKEDEEDFLANYLVTCKVCGQQVANSAKICPHCGKRRKMALWLKIVIGILVIAIVRQAMGTQNETTRSSSSSQNQTTVDPRPEKQKQFESVIATFSQQFDKAENELQESSYRKERMNAIKELKIDTQISGWTGTLNQLGTTTEGKAYITIKLNNNLAIGTWNNAFSDIGDNTLISMDSALYKTLINMKTGQKVIFSGSFISSNSNLDYFKEQSMTIRGAMKTPEYLMRFSSVETMN
jgi:hypothetical protein